MTRKNPHAVALGRRGGKVKSDAKTAANRENAKKPRPRTQKADSDDSSQAPPRKKR